MTEAIVKRERDEVTIPDAQNIEKFCSHLLKSGMFPAFRKVEEIIATVEYGRELGIPPIAALNTIVPVRGRLTMEAKAMLAVAQKNAGVSWKVDIMNNDECKMTFMRDGFEPCVVAFTAEEAKTAGLLSKDSWRTYRQDMLFARCASRGIRRIAPDAVLGLYSSEEMRDVDAAAKKDLEGAARPAAPPGATLDAEVVKEGENAEAPDDGEAEQDVPFDDPEGDEEQEPPVEDTEGEAPDPAPAAGPAPEAKPAAAPSDPIKQTYVSEIKRFITEEKLDPKEFKKFLVEQGRKMNRRFVGKVGANLSITEGDMGDLRYLVGAMPKAIALFKKEQGLS